MSGIRVQFFGICTHMEPQTNVIGPLPPADWGHRMVLVNASSQEWIDSFPQLKGKNIRPHIARLKISKSDLIIPPPWTDWFPIVASSEDAVVWELRGVSMTIYNAVPSDADEQGICVPHLAPLAPDGLPQAGPPTYDRIPKSAACYFDFPHGLYYGRVYGQAVVGVMDVQLSGDPAIEVESFTGKGKVTIPVRASAEISLSNIPIDPGAEKEDDFLLHFTLCENFPPNAGTPTATSPACLALSTYNLPDDLAIISGPGCSNSNYP